MSHEKLGNYFVDLLEECGIFFSSEIFPTPPGGSQNLPTHSPARAAWTPSHFRYTFVVYRFEPYSPMLMLAVAWFALCDLLHVTTCV